MDVDREAAAEPAVMAFVPPALNMSSKHAPLWNAALSFAATPLPLGDQRSAQFTLAGPPARGQIGHKLALVGKGGKTACDVWLCPLDFPFEQNFGAALTLADLDKLPDALAKALHLGVRDAWLLAMEPHVSLRPGAMEQAGPALIDAGLIWFDVQLEGAAAAPCRGLVGFEQGAMAAFLTEGGSLPGLGAGKVRFPQLAEKLTTIARISVGRVPVLVSELRDLAMGDLLVLPAGEGTPGQKCELALREIRITLERQEEGWTVTARQEGSALASPRDLTETGEDAMAEEAETEAEAGGGPSVVLDLDIGKIDVPLQALETWTEGTVVPLDLPEADPAEVTVRLNGRAVALGRLVKLDDRLAVELSEVLL